jgi:hypothetical protein
MMELIIPQILVDKGILSIVLFNVSFHNKFVLRSSISAKLKASSQFGLVCEYL